MTDVTEIDASAAPDADDIFNRLVHVTNTTNFEVPITLHVRGVVTSGKLISGATFWRESAAELREQANGPREAIEAMAEGFERVAETYRTRYEASVPDPEQQPRDAFVHLRDARTVTPEGALPVSGSLWRARVGSVDAFSLGELRMPPPERLSSSPGVPPAVERAGRGRG